MIPIKTNITKEGERIRKGGDDEERANTVQVQVQAQVQEEEFDDEGTLIRIENADDLRESCKQQ